MSDWNVIVRGDQGLEGHGWECRGNRSLIMRSA